MSRFPPEPTSGGEGKTAVVLINLGTPEAPTPAALRRYLKEFLSDPRVVEIPRALWWLILNVFILNLRPKKSAAKYAAIWTPEGSPLKFHSERQAKLLRGYLGHAGYPSQRLVVEYAMRYGEPSIPRTLSRLKESGCERILLLPLYPQYASSTSASSIDAAFAWASKLRNQPEIRTTRSFHDDPGYIEALAASVRQHWFANGRPSASYRLVMSFHGVPLKTRAQGDPYFEECQKTGQLLAAALGLAEGEYAITFQSRFGYAKWLAPYTATTLAALGRAGVQRVDIMCPGFPADCLETLEEIAIEGKATFLQAGGGEFHFIAGLNERDEWIHALTALTIRQLEGWPTRVSAAAPAPAKLPL
jgi:ferrochelatase